MPGSSAKESALTRFILRKVNAICTLSYVLGILWFLALSYRDLGASEYHSENALLTGLQQLNFGWGQSHDAARCNRMLAEYAEKKDPRGLRNRITELMEEFGIYTYTQEFSSRSPLPETVDGKLVFKMRNGTNLYGIIRAGRAASTESIVLNVPISTEKHNHAAGIALALGSQIKGQLYWAKDIILLFTDLGYVGAQAWLQSYFDTKNSDFIQSAPLQERAGTILAALVLEMPEVVNYVNGEVVGNNGQLPNLDVFRVFTKLCSLEDVRVAINGELTNNYINPWSTDSYLLSLKTAVTMMSKQARGFSYGNHAMFLQYNIQSMSLKGVEKRRMRAVDTMRVGRVIEGIARSMNNLLEKLHHSYFFYLISSTDRFISVGLYSPAMGLIILAPVLKALCLWMGMRVERESKDEGEKVEEECNNSDETDSEDDAIEELIKETKALERLESESNSSGTEDSIWMQVIGIVAMTNLLGVGLFFSPKFAVSWSKMFGLTAKNSLLLIFMTTYVVGLALPFTIFRFSREKRVLNLLRVVGLVLYAGIMGCVAVINFSLGMLVSVASVPFITPIRARTGKMRVLNVFLAVFCSPVSVAILLTTADQIFSGSAIDVLSSADNILTNLYEQALLGNNWIYHFSCLLLYPSWLVFWYLSAVAVE